MSISQSLLPVKFFLSLIYREQSICDAVVTQAKHVFGDCDFFEARLPFAHTDYYAAELGSPLFRCFMGFQTLMPREALVERKIWAWEIERVFQKGDSRTINVDPGYLNDAQLVLATGKNFSHRVYLGRGVFANVTLIYKHKKYESLPWTYPDYQQEPLASLLPKMRLKYKEELKHGSLQKN